MSDKENKKKTISKKKDKSKNLSMRSIYQIVNHRELADVQNIKDTFVLKSNFKNFFDQHKVSFIIYTLMFLIVFILTFWKTPLNMIYVILFMIIMFLFGIYNYTYTLRVTSKDIVVKYHMDTIRVPYDKLFNIYLARYNVAGFSKSYVISILYTDDKKENLLKMNFPTLGLKHEDLLNFFDNMTFGHDFDEGYDEVVAKKEKEDKRRAKHKATSEGKKEDKIIFIFFIVLTILIVAMCIGAFVIFK